MKKAICIQTFFLAIFIFACESQNSTVVFPEAPSQNSNDVSTDVSSSFSTSDGNAGSADQEGNNQSTTDLDSNPATDTAQPGTNTDLNGTVVTASHRPVLLVHGVNGDSGNFSTMVAALINDGWDASTLVAVDFSDPKWGCNIDNADTVKQAIIALLQNTGASTVDVIAHSMGTLSTRYFIKNLEGSKIVSNYITLGGMHHGLSTPCLSPFKPCVWEEMCESGDFISQLNAVPATPGPTQWTSIYSTADDTVPHGSSHLNGATNISFDHLSHTDLLIDLNVYDEILQILQ